MSYTYEIFEKKVAEGSFLFKPVQVHYTESINDVICGVNIYGYVIRYDKSEYDKKLECAYCWLPEKNKISAFFSDLLKPLKPSGIGIFEVNGKAHMCSLDFGTYCTWCWTEACEYARKSYKSYVDFTNQVKHRVRVEHPELNWWLDKEYPETRTDAYVEIERAYSHLIKTLEFHNRPFSEIKNSVMQLLRCDDADRIPGFADAWQFYCDMNDSSENL